MHSRPPDPICKTMCGRFSSCRSPEQIARRFRTTNPLPNSGPRYNAAPAQAMLVVRFDPQTRQRSLDPIRWGLIPHWAKDSTIGNRLINARAESIAEKPAFRDAFRRRRCLIPADGFFEWRKDTRPKQPYFIRMKDGDLFAFAGLWENWRAPEGTRPESERWVRTFTIITTGANALVHPIHDRMPAIIAPANYGKWLGDEAATPSELHAMLTPFPAGEMEAYPVGHAVNDVHHDDASLLEPLTGLPHLAGNMSP